MGSRPWKEPTKNQEGLVRVPGRELQDSKCVWVLVPKAMFGGVGRLRKGP